MQKPNNYEATQASGDFTPIELGGHILVIKEVLEMKSKTGKDMLKVSFDMGKGDAQEGYFADSFKNDIRPERKWPAAGTTYILAEDQDGNCSRQLKTFITAAEKSNPGFQVVWGDGFSTCFKNKAIGGVFGIVEEEYNGEIKKRRKLRWFRSAENILTADIPADKLLTNTTTSKYPAPGPDGFISIPDGVDDEDLPFN